MEIEVLGVDGVPPETIVSIRAGASRRQAPVSALSGGVPFRFPTGPKGLNPFKVDLFQPLCSARLALKPEAGIYECPIDGSGVKVKFTVNESGKDPTGAVQMPRMEATPVGDKPQSTWPTLLPREDDPNFPNTAAAVKDYLDNHHLLKFVKALLQTVVREQPRDPFQFIADQFRTAATAAKTGGDVTSHLEGGSIDVSQGDLPNIANAQKAPRELASMERLRTNSTLETPDETVRTLATNALTAAALNAAFTAAGLPADDSLKVASRELPTVAEAARKGAVAVPPVAVQRPRTPDETQNSAAGMAQQPVASLLGKPQPMEGGDAQQGIDLAVAKEQARGALLNVLAAGEQHHEMAARGEAPSGVELESAKADAIQALMAVFGPSESADTGDMQRHALDTMAAVLDEGDSSRPGSAPIAGEELEAAKAGAIEALLAVMKSDGDDRSDVDFSGLFGNAIEDAKQKAVEQLVDAVGDLHEEAEKKEAGLVLSEEDEELAKLKVSAMNALAAAFSAPELVEEAAREEAGQALLPGDAVEQATDEAEEIKLKAQDALAFALLEDADETQCEPGDAVEQATDDAEEIKLKAQDALAFALLEDEAEGEDLPAKEWEPGVAVEQATDEAEEIKLKAQDALAFALLEDEAEGEDLAAKENEPGDAAEQALEEAEEVKQKAKHALSLALLKEADEMKCEPGDAVFEVLVDEAKLLHVMEEAEELKLKAKHALSLALLKEADEMGIELEEEDLQEVTDAAEVSVEQALREAEGEDVDILAMKERTKKALRSSLLGVGAAIGVEGVDALRATLGTPGQASEVGGVSAASVEIPAGPPGGVNNRKQSFRESPDPPRAAAEEAKASLMAAKEELMQLNAELRSEVTELSEVFEGLLKERELLKQQLTQA